MANSFNGIEQGWGNNLWFGELHVFYLYSWVATSAQSIGQYPLWQNTLIPTTGRASCDSVTLSLVNEEKEHDNSRCRETCPGVLLCQGYHMGQKHIQVPLVDSFNYYSVTCRHIGDCQRRCRRDDSCCLLIKDCITWTLWVRDRLPTEQGH